MGIFLTPDLLSATTTAFKAKRGVAVSAAGEALAIFPPMVALFLVVGSAKSCAASLNAGAYFSIISEFSKS
jgi:hypothetical protein